MRAYRIWQESDNSYALHPDSIGEQATGVFDSNGREIFEGDIVLQHMSMELEKSGRKPNRGHVYYDRGSFFIYGGGPIWSYLDDESSVLHEYQIIGNVRKNPDLIP